MQVGGRDQYRHTIEHTTDTHTKRQSALTWISSETLLGVFDKAFLTIRHSQVDTSNFLVWNLEIWNRLDTEAEGGEIILALAIVFQTAHSSLLLRNKTTMGIQRGWTGDAFGVDEIGFAVKLVGLAENIRYNAEETKMIVESLLSDDELSYDSGDTENIPNHSTTKKKRSEFDMVLLFIVLHFSNLTNLFFHRQEEC